MKSKGTTNDRIWRFIFISTGLAGLVLFVVFTLSGQVPVDERSQAIERVAAVVNEDESSTLRPTNIQTYTSFQHAFSIDVPFDWTVEELASGLGLGDPTLDLLKGRKQSTSIFFASPETRLAFLKCLGTDIRTTCENLQRGDVVVSDAESVDETHQVLVGNHSWYRQESQAFQQHSVEYAYPKPTGGFYLIIILNGAREQEIMDYLATFQPLVNGCLPV